MGQVPHACKPCSYTLKISGDTGSMPGVHAVRVLSLISCPEAKEKRPRNEYTIICRRLLRIIVSVRSPTYVKWPANGRQGTPESSRHGASYLEVGCAGDWWICARLRCREADFLPRVTRFDRHTDPIIILALHIGIACILKARLRIR